MVDVLIIEDDFAVFLLHNELLDSGCSVSLSHFGVTLEKSRQQTHEALKVVIWKLVSEHVHKLDASGLEYR